jgi:hypothetical protein
VKLGKFLCFSKSIGGKDRPRGIIWLTACFMYANIRLLPVGYVR